MTHEELLHAAANTLSMQLGLINQCVVNHKAYCENYMLKDDAIKSVYNTRNALMDNFLQNNFNVTASDNRSNGAALLKSLQSIGIVDTLRSMPDETLRIIVARGLENELKSFNSLVSYQGTVYPNQVVEIYWRRGLNTPNLSRFGNNPIPSTVVFDKLIGEFENGAAMRMDMLHKAEEPAFTDRADRAKRELEELRDRVNKEIHMRNNVSPTTKENKNYLDMVRTFRKLGVEISPYVSVTQVDEVIEDAIKIAIRREREFKEAVYSVDYQSRLLQKTLDNISEKEDARGTSQPEKKMHMDRAIILFMRGNFGYVNGTPDSQVLDDYRYMRDAGTAQFIIERRPSSASYICQHRLQLEGMRYEHAIRIITDKKELVEERNAFYKRIMLNENPGWHPQVKVVEAEKTGVIESQNLLIDELNQIRDAEKAGLYHMPPEGGRPFRFGPQEHEGKDNRGYNKNYNRNTNDRGQYNGENKESTQDKLARLNADLDKAKASGDVEKAVSLSREIGKLEAYSSKTAGYQSRDSQSKTDNSFQK